MKTLRQACTPRASVFDSTKRDTVPDILDLAKGKIDPAEFFAENYATQGMRTLLSEAFKRLDGGAQAQGIFRLSQSMVGCHQPVRPRCSAVRPLPRVSVART